MKFNKGQLVEVINDPNDPRFIGCRFVVSACKYRADIGHFMYALPERLQDEFQVVLSAREHNLKLVNPDNDEQSDFTFNELMSDLTKSNQLTHNTKQNEETHS